MNHPLVIGLTGRARHGKDTVADYLCTHYDLTRLAFADPIRDMLELGLNISTQYSVDNKETTIPWIGASYRELAQTLGTEWGRARNPDLWLNVMKVKLVALADEFDAIVISDVRFQNEADWVRQIGTLWHVHRPDAPRIGHPNHSSEQGIDYDGDSDHILHNDGSLTALYQTIDRVFNQTLAQRKAP